MKKKKKLSRFNAYLCFFLCLFILLGSISIIEKSPTFDEPLHLADGIANFKFLKFRFGIEHPPFLRLMAALPSFFYELKFPASKELIRKKSEVKIKNWSPVKDFTFAKRFFYLFNPDKTEALFFLGRFAILLLGIPLFFVIERWTKHLYGERRALITLILLALTPNILAHARLITTDFGSSVFIVCGAYFLWKFTGNLRKKHFLLSAFFWGLALVSKYSAIFFFIVFHITAFFYTKSKKKFFYFFLLEIPVLVFMINACFFFTEPVGRNFFRDENLSFIPGYARIPVLFFSKFLLIPEIYTRGIFYSFYHSLRGHGTYLIGRYSNLGWWYYFPLAFLIKSTTTFLFLFVLSILSLKKRKLSKDEIFFIIPSVLFLLFMMKSHLNIGVRHILILWMFGAVFCARSGVFIRKKFIIFVYVFALFENLFVFPHYISQINLFLGGPKKGYKYLADSNLDWGQDLKILSKWWKRQKRPLLILSYFGTGEPFFYGMEFVNCLSLSVPGIYEILPQKNSHQKFFAISVTNLLGVYRWNKDLFAYFRDKKPDARAGYSIYIYDITDDLKAQKILKGIFKAQGRDEIVKKYF
ncbi:MAG: glycosyltransferase family 39 protein [Elusimicrobia bacterium]|nr:glycosyltransferase family 39 protein [Elusimicrobiota bacterium]